MTQTAPDARPMLELAGIDKSFTGVHALKGVDFRLLPGEVHALMGQNGAGKSTLIKVMTGVHPPDRGQILLDGAPIHPASPLDAQRLGISTVYQEVNLCPNLSVAENIFIGRYPMKGPAIDWKTMRAQAAQILAGLNIHADVGLQLASCSVAMQQMVAIARATSVSCKILILDEPTSSLDEDEVRMLFAVIRGLRDKGLAILFVTHFLDQTYEIADRITVLRNGERVGEYPVAELPKLALVTKMIGREIRETSFRRNRAEAAEVPKEPFLEARGIGRQGSVHPMDLDIRRGEVLGLGGLLGSGRTETARLLFGIDRVDRGSMRIAGEEAAIASPRDAVQRGIGFCPEDRKVEGVVSELSVRENIVLALQSKRGLFRVLPRRRQEAIAAEYIQALGIKVADMEKPVSELSGGNQQKVLLARWLATDPQMLILDEPTRGIDVGAKLEIMEQMLALCRKGMAILFTSSELEEIVNCSDRIAILRDRRKIDEVPAASTDEQAILHVIAGGQAQ
ncbi:MAG TPA: sugar ABC transporter ATP-binding protein [Burkholderiales bacterium]|nr:sugar ABC transporter ATP-binding protein [Burkholderiales bacterium]